MVNSLMDYLLEWRRTTSFLRINIIRSYILRTETVEYLGLSNGEIIIKDSSFNLSNDQKVDLLLSYSYEEQKKLYDSYNPPGSLVIAGCCSLIILAMIISSSSGSKNSGDSGGFWRAFENFLNGFFND